MRRHPPYAEMVVEGVHSMMEPKGSSAPAVANWIQASQYGGLVNPDEARFKANVATGIRQALTQGKLTKVRTSYRVSQEHLKLLARERAKIRRRERQEAERAAAEAEAEESRPRAG
ncbi:unnamed protein product, partial [Discosporangium mesarthrocarpum]